jgi:hypothetical protein
MAPITIGLQVAFGPSGSNVLQQCRAKGEALRFMRFHHSHPIQPLSGSSRSIVHVKSTGTWIWCSVPRSIQRSNPHLNRDGASLAFGVTNSLRPFKTEMHARPQSSPVAFWFQDPKQVRVDGRLLESERSPCVRRKPSALSRLDDQRIAISVPALNCDPFRPRHSFISASRS